VCPIYPSRFPNHIHFPDYKPDELLEIAKRMVAKMLFRFGDGVIDALREKLSRPLPGNARDVRGIVEAAKKKLDGRVGEIQGRQPTRDDLTTLEVGDFA
jgi:stage V sporulation protein K